MSEFEIELLKLLQDIKNEVKFGLEQIRNEIEKKSISYV